MKKCLFNAEKSGTFVKIRNDDGLSQVKLQLHAIKVMLHLPKTKENAKVSANHNLNVIKIKSWYSP